MKTVSGRVLLKETGSGIPDLLVELHDVEPAASGTASLTSLPTSTRLGSVPTAADGSFSLEYEGAERRPELLLVVRAPEEMGGSPTDGVLHVSKSTRRGAGSTEFYLVRIPSKTLSAAGMHAPTELSLAADEPSAVVEKIDQSVARNVAIRQALTKIAAQQVTAERERTAAVATAVQARLVETMTGVPARLFDRLNFVPPGAEVEPAMYRALRKTIERTINTAPPASGFIVLSREQAERFRAADGSLRTDVTPAEVEPFMFGAAPQTARPSFYVRRDPMDALASGSTQLLAPSRRTSAIEGPSPEEIAGATITVPDLVSRMLSTMTAPEEAVSFGVRPRADQESVDTQIGALALRSGPADVPAFYDFHSLQIAFDYVWQKAIDEGVLEGATALGREILELGGDPIGAMSSPVHPIQALRDELQTVRRAHATTDLAVLFRPKGGNDVDPSTDSGEPPTPPLPPKPPTPVPPRTSHLPDSIPEARRDDLLNQIEDLLTQRHSFDLFAPGSANFGVLVTYRQKWTPISYQVGGLVKTITLAPKETRKVSTKRVVKKDRSVKEMENSLRVRKEESSQTARDEAEIVAKAEAKTNFSLTAQGSYDLGFADGNSTMVFGKDASTSSSDTKKAFREAVIKAAQEYKDERKVEVETRESYETEATEVTEIGNPNDELALTYLFYELQRRYRVAEHIHRLTPVVLVAMDVPTPSRRSIDALLLTHGWIIDRVLLDDQFRRPLEYFRTKIVGEERALETLRSNLAEMRAVVAELKLSYTRARASTNTLADLLTAKIVAKGEATDATEAEGFWEKAREAFSGDDDVSVEAARIYEDAARERHERAVNQERELRAQLESETAALRSASDAYARANAEHLNCLADVGALRLHIKENILFYMQAVWSHTFKDQLFLALHKRRVPRLATRKQSYLLSEPGDVPASVTTEPGQVVLGVSTKLELEGDLDPEQDFVTLAEVADLDNLLGFKGNYLIFPLKVSNALTDFMMTPYVDAELGLRDPDPLGNFTPQEFVEYARALHAQLLRQREAGEISEEEVTATVDRLTAQLRRLLSEPRRAEDEITVPTGSLYIEALPAARPILEDFKLLHRAVDVKKELANLRRGELEALRYAARILDGEHEDPDVERRIVIDGGNPLVVNPTDP